MAFIRNFWSPNHILGIDKDFFVYEHGSERGKLNFLIAVCKDTREIRAIQGFIPYSDNKEKLHVCGVMSKTHPNNNVPFLGLETMNRMLHAVNPVSYCGIGTNPKTMLPLVKKFLKRHVGVMSHYYMLNKNLKEFRIAIPDPSETALDYCYLDESAHSLERVSDCEDISSILKSIEISPSIPFKSSRYIVRRYFNNPIYTYKTYKICDQENKAISLVVTREVWRKNRCILNLVD